MGEIDGGLWSILATPFEGPALEVDRLSLEKQVDFCMTAGAVGVVALGVFGEAASLSRAERQAVVKTVMDVGDQPTIVGIASRRLRPALDEAEDSLSGPRAPTALMVQVPVPDVDSSVKMLNALHATTELPLVLQDYPEISGVHVTPSELASIAEGAKGVLAVKVEAHPTVTYVRELYTRGTVQAFGGLGGLRLADELFEGASGAMTGFSRPWALVETIRHAKGGDWRGAYDAWSQALPAAVLEAQPGYALSLRKQLLARAGVIGNGAVRPPASRAPAWMVERILQLPKDVHSPPRLGPATQDEQ